MPIFVRYCFADREHYGLLAGEERVRRITGSPFDGFQETGEILDLAAVRILPPCRPTKVIAVGLNYRDHAREFNLEVPDEPLVFMKPASALLAHGEPIVAPTMSQRVDFEAELGVVLGRTCRKVTREQAREYILGFICVNDVTARDLQSKDGQWTRAKSFDTFCPVGPFLVTEVNPADLAVQSYLNGELRQSSRTRELIFSVEELVSFISQIMTLFPGDIISTGTPSGVGPMKPGDTIEIRVEQVGRLVNTVVGE
jgi:2-keto-4-pentenoate hydratase/2-oxohepta-3-ene-1,7-dioic acid hydratase in catechol pathway